MQLCFLFGAGASIPVLGIGTPGLTKQVLSGAGAWKASDARYYVGGAQDDLAHAPVEKVTALLAIIAPYIQTFLKEQYGRVAEANYEDLYYACDQVASMLSGELENPLISEYARVLEQDADKFRLPTDRSQEARTVVRNTSREACRYIRDVVGELLGKETDSVALRRCQRLLLDALADSSISGADILTLNHDVLLEDLLRSDGLAFVDGFVEHIEGVRRWNGGALFEPASIRLFKMHGSIDWYRFRSGPLAWWDDWLGQVRRGVDPDRVPVGNGALLDCLDGPEFLLGSFNKIMDYTRPGFLDLFSAAWMALRRSRVLIVSGYSFSDKGINARITDWVHSEPPGARRLVVIHPDPDRVAGGARGAVRNKWQEWRSRGVLHTITAKLEDASWAEVRRALA